MKRVMQTKFGKPDGNCFQACIAALFEFPIEAVPHFWDETHPGEWFFKAQEWFRQQGYHYTSISIKSMEHLDAINISGGTYFIVGGLSPRGLDHCVVVRNGSIFHDPHPEGGGIEGPFELSLISPLVYRLKEEET